MNFLDAYKKAIVMCEELDSTDTIYLYRPCKTCIVEINFHESRPSTKERAIDKRTGEVYNYFFPAVYESGLHITHEDILANDWIVDVKEFKL